MAVSVSKKGSIVIPADLRKKYNLTPGRKVNIVDYGGVLAIVPASDDPVHQAIGMLGAKGEMQKQTLVDALLEEHRQKWSRE